MYIGNAAFYVVFCFMDKENIVAIPVGEEPIVEEPKREKHEPIGSIDATQDAPTKSFSNYGEVPYTAKFLGMEEDFRFDPEGEYRIKIAEVEGYLLSKMNQDNIAFAEAWLKKLGGELDFRDEEKGVSKLKRLHAYIKAKERIDRLSAHKSLLKKTIEEENGKQAN